MKRSIAPGATPRARLLSTLSASAAPARNTKAGAQTCVTQRVKNCAAGSGVRVDSSPGGGRARRGGGGGGGAERGRRWGGGGRGGGRRATWARVWGGGACVGPALSPAGPPRATPRLLGRKVRTDVDG